MGVVLDEPTGNHSGKIHGREYFQCPPFQGLFVRAHRVSRLPDSALSSSASPSSRSSTPMPTNYGNYLAQSQQQQPSSSLSSKANQSNDNHINSRINSILRIGSRNSDRTKSPGTSTLDSYYYDEDYRPDRRPTLESITRKLRSIDDDYNNIDNHRESKQTTKSLRESTRLPGRESTKTTRFLERLDSLEPIEGTATKTIPKNPQGTPSILKSRLTESFNSPNRRFRSSSVAPTVTRVKQPEVPTITKSLDREPVFNFRPKREQLDSHKILHNSPQRVARSTSNLGETNRRANNCPEDNSNRNNMSYSMYRSATPTPVTGRASVDLTSEPARKGDRVIVKSERGELTGILRFMGETEFATGEWAGVELDRAEGKNDGSILGVRYFHCPNNYGLFVPATRVKKYRPSSAQSGYSTSSASPVMPKVFDSVRSTITSPPPVTPGYTTSKGSESFNYNSPYSSSNSYSNHDSPIHHYSDGRPLSSAYSSSSLHQDPYNSKLSTVVDKSHRFDDDLYALNLSFKNNSNLLGNSVSSNSLLSRPSSSSSSYLDSFSPNTSSRYKPSKFDDADIEYQLRRNLNRSSNLLRASGYDGHNIGTGVRQTNGSAYNSTQRPKYIKYTFTTSKYDGNPIARRTVAYD